MGSESTSIDASKARSKGKWPATLINLVAVFEAHFLRRGLAKSTASDEAKAATLTLAQYLGGRPIYLPFGLRIQNALRDAEIFAQANGQNTRELSVKYKTTERNIQRIVKEQTTLRRTKLDSAVEEAQ